MQNDPTNQEVRELLETLTFVPVNETPFYNGPEFQHVAYNDEFVIFHNDTTVEWTTMNGFYSGEFKLQKK